MAAWTKTQAEVGGFSMVEHTVPTPGPGEVLVKTLSTSVCGTDLHIWKWDDWSRENVPLGTVTGHETSGTVAALGPGVESHSVGDLSPSNVTWPVGPVPDATKETPTSARTGPFSASMATGLLRLILSSLPSMRGTFLLDSTQVMPRFKIRWATPSTP